jgi:membrane protease YdiL (CAAX protease family)
MLLPAVCTVILQIINRKKPFKNLNMSFRFNRWFIVAGIVPILLTFMALGINLLFPGVSFSITSEGFLASLPADQVETARQQMARFPPVVFLLIQVLLAIPAGYTINAFFAFGEELGWRSYLLKALGNIHFLHVSLITGTVWGLWHFPLILAGHNYPQHPVPGVAMMVVWCILLSPVITYITIKSKSVITAAVYHGTFNAVAGIGILYISGGNDLTNGVTGIAGFAALLVANIVLYLFDKYVTKENILTSPTGYYLD